MELPIIGILVFLFFASIRVAQEYERAVVFSLGKFKNVKGPGLYFLIPIIETATKVSLRTITMEIPSQKIITKDNVSIDIAAVAYYHIVDPKKSVIAIENVYTAVNQISQTTVRNVIGQFSLDQLLSQTVKINDYNSRSNENSSRRPKRKVSSNIVYQSEQICLINIFVLKFFYLKQKWH